MKKAVLIIVILMIIFLLSALFIFLKSKNLDQKVSKEIPKEKTIAEIVDEELQKMSIEEKIAQMLIINPSNNYLDDDLKNTLQTTPIGGFIIMENNISTYDNTKQFIDDLNSISIIKPIISIDQEGGNVQRLQKISDTSPIYIPHMYDLGKTNDKKLAYDVGKVIAQNVRTLNINVTYAPVVDVYSNPNNKVIGKRSFSEDPNIVASMAVNLAKGIEDNKVIATYKHFPGHGDTSIDSHQALPIINKTMAELEATELIPFKAAIKNNAKIIMVGHIALPKITGDNTPATLSPKITTDLLRKKLKYQGLIITDALNMGALVNNYSEEDIYIKAINAGNDLLLMPNSITTAINTIKNNISEERINESVRKILLFKKEYLFEDISLNKSYLNTQEQRDIINRIYEGD